MLSQTINQVGKQTKMSQNTRTWNCSSHVGEATQIRPERKVGKEDKGRKGGFQRM